MMCIVAVDRNWGIGYKNKMPWNIPGELSFFREKTMGNTVVMGRKTLESLPGGKALPGRRNIVLSRDNSLSIKDAEVVTSVEELLSIVQKDTVYIIGGEQIYKLLLPYCSKAYVTKVTGIYETDTSFPMLDRDCSWHVESIGEEVSSPNGVTYRRFVYTRVTEID